MTKEEIFEDWLEDTYPEGPMLRQNSLGYRVQIEMLMREAFLAGWESKKNRPHLDLVWSCPISYPGCTKNCGSYGCGN